MRTLTLLIALLGPGALFAQNTITATIQSGGLTREYLLYVPAAYTGATPVPLVFNLHGYGSNNLEQFYYADFRAIADTANFLLAVPNGTFDNSGNRFWAPIVAGAAVDDVGFIRDLLDTLATSYNIDPNRVYSTGMSNGGFMSYALACELNDRIAAIASVTGSMIQVNLNACTPVRPVPVMEIHGTADDVVPYTGLPSATFVAIPAVVEAWVDFNHCNPTPVVTQVPNISTTDACTAERYLYSGGLNGSTVEHFKVIGGGHTWPGSFFSIGVTNQDIQASREIWRFFSQYRLDVLTAAPEPAPFAAHWTASPNPVGDYVVLSPAFPGVSATRVRVYDAAGRLVAALHPDAGAEAVRVSTGGWVAGTYVAVVEWEGKVERLVVVK